MSEAGLETQLPLGQYHVGVGTRQKGTEVADRRLWRASAGRCSDEEESPGQSYTGVRDGSVIVVCVQGHQASGRGCLLLHSQGSGLLDNGVLWMLLLKSGEKTQKQEVREDRDLMGARVN